MRLSLSILVLLAATVPLQAQRSYPMKPNDLCGTNQTCQAVLNRWNQASWADLVDDAFQQQGATPLAAVRWYSSEGSYNLRTDPACPSPNAQLHTFCGVTDEFSNVLLNHAMGTDQSRYHKLRNFAELLRHPAINNLQCWKFRIDGTANYASYAQVCAAVDSASDASVRILGAYGIACAKQAAGVWQNNGVDFCADYVRQGNAIFGRGTALHGEVKQLPNGELFLANGFNNQAGAPTVPESFRPDYYELQFLMDFAKYARDASLMTGVNSMLAHYSRALGNNHVHGGKTGHFTDSSATSYQCDGLCTPDPYMDNIDTWRAIPALSGLLNVHPEQVPASLKSQIYGYWWTNFSGGHPTLYSPGQDLAFEIYSDRQSPAVKWQEHSYKTLSMWIPLAAAQNALPYLQGALAQLVDVKYDGANEQFYGAAYYGGYFSQFAQRAIGAATGMIDPAFWTGNLVKNPAFTNGTASWWLSVSNGSSATISVTGALLELRMAIAAGGAAPWDLIFGQGGISLLQGTTYELSFDARAAAGRTLNYRVVKTSGDWREYTNQVVNLTTTTQRFTTRFTVSDTVSPTTNLEFRAGGQGPTDVFLDNIQLVKVN